MTTMAEVKRLLGFDGERLQVLFITVNPERDTTELLRDYMQNFDSTFLALRPEPEALKAVATDFKIYFKQVPGPSHLLHNGPFGGQIHLRHPGQATLFFPPTERKL